MKLLTEGLKDLKEGMEGRCSDQVAMLLGQG